MKPLIGLTLSHFFHKDVELSRCVGISHGHLLKDFAAGQFVHSALLYVTQPRRPQHGARSVENFFDVGFWRQLFQDVFRIDRVAQEHHVVCPLFVAVPTRRQTLDQFLHFRETAHDDFAFKFVMRRQQSLDLCFQLSDIGLRAGEEDVAAVDVGRNILKTGFRKIGFQRRHA